MFVLYRPHFRLLPTNTKSSNYKCIPLSSVLSGLLLLDDGELDSVALGQGDHGLVSLADDEHVGKTGGELVTSSISHVHDIEGTEVAIAADNGAHATSVVSLGDVAQVASLELDVTDDLASLEVHLHGVVDLHHRIGVADGAGVVSHNEGDLLAGQLALLDLAQLELGLGLIDAVENETSLHIVEKAEAVVGTLEGDHIYENKQRENERREKEGEGESISRNCFLPMKPAG